jgi:EpsI family protein
MKKPFDKSFLLIIALFAVAGAISGIQYSRQYIQKDTVNIHVFPKEIGGWTATELPITDKEYDILETRNAFTRKYVNPDGKAVYLFIVYSQYNRKVSHPPEVCYTGSGATISKGVVVEIPADSLKQKNIKANKLWVEQSVYQQLMYYWFKVGNTFTPSYWQQQILIALKSLLGQPSSSAMVRLSVDVEDKDEQKAVKLIEDFSSQITPLLFKYLP